MVGVWIYTEQTSVINFSKCRMNNIRQLYLYIFKNTSICNQIYIFTSSTVVSALKHNFSKIKCLSLYFVMLYFSSRTVSNSQYTVIM